MKNKVCSYTRTALAVALASGLLFGCGGSSKSSGGPSSGEPFSATSSGVAAKGIIRHAVVTAEELNVSGGVLATVGTAVTGTNGAYELTIGPDYAGGVIRLSLSAKDDTVMVCDVQPKCDDDVAFGETMPLGSAFVMHSIMPPVDSGTSVNAQITPLTHMAAARVAGQGTFDADTVKTSVSQVNQMVGVNILDTPPVDITQDTSSASPQALMYAAFTAGIGQLLFEDAEGLEAGLQKLAEAFGDGTLDADDAISVTAILDAVHDQATASGIVSDELTHHIAAVESQVSEDGSYAPQAPDSATLSGIEQARALVTQTRTWVTSLAELETPLQALAADLDVMGEVFDVNAAALAELTGMVLEAAMGALEAAGDEGLPAPGTYQAAVQDSEGTEIGTVTVVLTDDGGIGLTIEAAGLTQSQAAVSLALNTNVPLAALEQEELSLTDLTFGLTGSVQNSAASLSFDAFDVAASLDELTEELTGFAMSGALTVTDKLNGMSFTGNAELTLVALAASEAGNPISLQKVALGGGFTGNGNSFSASAALTINNAATFDTIALLEHEPYMWVYHNEPGDLLGAVAQAGDYGITSLVSAYITAHGETCFYGFDSMDAPQAPCVPEDVLGWGGYVAGLNPAAEVVEHHYHYSADDHLTSIGGRLYFGDFETAEAFADATLTATFSLALQGYPDTSAVVTVNRTALAGGDALLTLAHAGHSVTFQAEKSGDEPGIGALTVTNPDGAKLIVSAAEGAVSGEVTVNGTKVGEIKESSNGLLVLRYVDGTFETLQ